MGRLGDLAIVDLLQSVDALASRVEGVHKMHGYGLSLVSSNSIPVLLPSDLGFLPSAERKERLIWRGLGRLGGAASGVVIREDVLVVL